MDESAHKVLKQEIFYPYEGRTKLPVISGFSEGKEYPIYEEHNLGNVPLGSPISFVSVTKDDDGRIRKIPSVYFKHKIVIKDEYVDDELLVGQPIHEDLRSQDGKHARLDVEGKLRLSGIPLAVMHFREMIKEAEDFRYLAGVNGSQNEILDKITSLEKQMETMCKAIRSLKEFATRTYSVERKER